MKVICGLGNPGREYERHRHNVGFRVLDALCARHRLSLNQNKFDARVGQGELRGERVLLVAPETFMNRSGQAVAPALRFYKAGLTDLLVIHDELDLPFGRLQLKNGGGAGGHNGLRSLIELLGEDTFARVRFGVGKPEGPNAKERVAGYVLSGFSAEEEKALPELVDRASAMVETWVEDGLQAAMNRHNRR